MKKLLVMALAAGMICSMAACGNKSAANSADAAADAASAAEENTQSTADSADAESDLAYIRDKGTLVVGITDFEPMDYKDADGNWIGFDADMAKAFAESIGVEAELIEIDWDNKILELDNKSIDCVWNGMTLTPEVTSSMDCTNAYSSNSQVVVISADVADQYQDVESLADLNFAVEAGSAGEGAAQENELNYTPVSSQANALMEVSAGTSDAAIIDLLMAEAMTGEGTNYADLTTAVVLVDEEYGVGFRKGSDAVEALNSFFAEKYADGTMTDIAAQYGIENSIIEQ